ncbi:hypothetical protein Adt_40237 [Abeliophyllum distichum]|uniref:Uncharacterized protein n=1 Tax=Abeliophyllum distichum TaxID=126358 RepID=A0ABD1Q7D9_9LAMI
MTFKVAWILCWDFQIFPNSDTAFFYKKIIRRCKVKWWKKFNESNCSKAIQSWIDQQKKTKTSTSSSQSDFLSEKSKIMSQLANCSNPKELAILAHKAASMAQAESSKGSIAVSEVGSNPDFEQDNEDDCFGTDFFEE